jgi:hypothetical protein
MGKDMQRSLRPETSVMFDAPHDREEQAAMLARFLNWLEMTQGMTLCQPFKPQFDWYMPALANKDVLAREFLGGQLQARREKGETQ